MSSENQKVVYFKIFMTYLVESGDVFFLYADIDYLATFYNDENWYIDVISNFIES